MSAADLFRSASAVISDCGRYRYRLTREWTSGPRCGFVMLNPSTADASEDDPTIRRCVNFAKREGCGSLTVINLFSLRATDPAALYAHPYPNGPDAARHNAEALRETDGPVICGWGGEPIARDHAGFMVDLIRSAGHAPMCFRLVKNGQPTHPLYVKRNAPLVPLVTDPPRFKRHNLKGD